MCPFSSGNTPANSSGAARTPLCGRGSNVHVSALATESVVAVTGHAASCICMHLIHMHSICLDSESDHEFMNRYQINDIRDHVHVHVTRSRI